MENQGIFNSITVDETAKAHFLETSRWTKFLAILGFVFLGLLILVGIMMAMGASAFSSDLAGAWGTAFGTAMAIMYIIIGLIYFFPIYYLYKFSTLIKPALLHNNQVQFNEAIWYQKRMYKFIGILMLIVLCLYALFFIVAIIGGMMS